MGRSTAAAAIALALVLTFTGTAAASPPIITYTIDGIAGTNGWYRGSTHGDNVILHWDVSNENMTDCQFAITVPGPTTGTTKTCSATNGPPSSPLTTTAKVFLKIDATPPTGLRPSFSRKPDYHGWYNHPVAIRWSGTDATSGIAGCSSVTYHGPDSGAATASGTCTDKAGNRATAPTHLAYDATPPVLGNVSEQSTAAADVLGWTSSSTSDRIVIRRKIRGHKASTTVFDGVADTFADKTIRPGNEYLYSVRSIDQAGNASSVASIAGPPKILTLQKTSYVVHAAANPILRWGRVRGATYYNVQLFRGSKRIFSAWPTMHQTGIPATWTWSGHRFRLTPGQYRWYVWAGLGARKLARYRLAGSERFVVPR
jgi:hypothetical protein